MFREPQEVEDREDEQAVARVAAVDVAKASGVVRTRVPREGAAGRFVTKVWPVDATTNAILKLADQLTAAQVEKVVLESTSDYWRPFFYLLEAAGLNVELVNARDVKNAPGRPKTDKLDAVWLAKLAGWGMLRPSFVPPAEIRQLRDYTRLRTDLTRERTGTAAAGEAPRGRADQGHYGGLPHRHHVGAGHAGALIAGQRDPRRLADLARGRMKAKRTALIEALTGRLDDHHGELAAILLAQIDALTVQIDTLTTRAGELITAIPAAHGVDADGTTGPQAGRGPDAPVLPAIDRLQEIPGISAHAAQVILAEVGLDMTRFPTAGHLVSWSRLCPRTLQSGARQRPGRTAKGNPYLKGVPGDAATAAGKTSTFLCERYRRLARRRGKLKALVAIARSLLVIIWHLLTDRAARYDDPGDNYYVTTISTDRKVRSHIRQLETLGYAVTVAPAA